MPEVIWPGADKTAAKPVWPGADAVPSISPYAKKGAGNFTTDLGTDEPKFQKWVKENKIPFDPTDKFSDYDMRGFWRGLETKDPHATTGINPNDQQLHFSDWWKTPYHKSFSVESQWADPATAPKWNDKDQLVTPDGKIVFDERTSQWPGADKPVAATQWPGADQPQQAVAPEPKREPVLPITSSNWRETPSRMMEWWQSQPAWGEQYSAGMERDQEQKAAGVPLTQRLMERAPLFEGFAGSGIMHGVKVPSIQPAVTQVQKILSPQSVSPIAGEAAGSIRAAGGTAARDTASTSAALEPWQELINSLPPEDQMGVINHIEGHSSNTRLFGPGSNQGPPLRAFADSLKGEMEKREVKLKALPSTDKMEFVKDYLAHFWQDPQAVNKIEAARAGGAGKQGSAASLKKRTVPTYADGIAAGLKPLTTNPIDITMRYVASMDKFIAAQTVLDTAKANGTVKYIRPKTMGASGHPDSFKVPEGYMPIKGRGATDKNGAQAYALEDFARVYNNYISRGFSEWDPALGTAVDAVQHASNMITALELGASGFHALNIATSAVASEVGRSVSNLVGGKPLRGLQAAGNALLSPASQIYKGHKVQQVYLGKSLGTPDMRKVVDVLTKSGGRLVGKHASDYEFSPMGSFWTAWKRGALKAEMARPGSKAPWNLIGRTMETISDPLFKDYIPKVKAAAQYDLLRDWIEANPTATHEQTMAMGRKIVDAMDDRFGEMIQDNLFVNKAFKQIAQIAMLSYSWTLGLGRQVAGAVKDPRKLSIGHKDYNPSVAGIIGAAVAVPMINAIYQKLKSGKDPESIDDLMAPRTGGEGFGASVPSTARGFHRASQARVPERAILPSHERDIFGWWYEPGQEFKNKFSFFPKMAMEWAMPGPTDVDLSDYLKIVGQSLMPISGQQLMRGHMEGSALGPGASVSGVRPAPSYLQDPEGYEKQKENVHTLAQRRKAAIERRQQSRYGGPQE